MPRPPITRARPYTPRGGALAGQTFHSERQYRNALARGRGFSSFATQQSAAKVVRTRAAYEKLRPAEREARERALEALSKWRRHEQLSLTGAARDSRTTLNVVKRYAGTELKRERGRLTATASDSLFRRMRLITDTGPLTIDVYSSKVASEIGRYDAAVKRYLETGDDRALRRFRNKKIRTGKQTHYFVTDLDTLDRLGGAGELSFESIYES
jgi:hypothetical protein